MKNFKYQSYIGASLFVLALASSCKSDFDKVVPGAPAINTGVEYKVPKVLYIIADGARGTSVRDAESVNIKSLIPNSIYTWNGLADTSKVDATNWADMITGVKKEKHGVLTEDFAANRLSQYPAIFQRIKSVNPKLRIATFAASSVFKTQLTGGADVSEALANDDAVKTRMVDFLKSDTASLVLGQFSGIEAAGKQAGSGFDNSFAPYKAAINAFDARVGELLTAVKARPNYLKENWLIIITSNRGGQFTLPANQDDKTVFSNTNANVFTIINNSGFKNTFIGKPFLGNSFAGAAVRYKGEPDKTQGLTASTVSPNFNFGNSDFTVSVKVKKSKPRNTSRGDYFYQWPSILGKRDQAGWGNENPGWDICLFYNGWRFFGQGGTGFDRGTEIGGLDFSGGTWHDLTFTVERKADNSRYVRMYTDGVKGVTNGQDGSNRTWDGPGGSPSSPVNVEVKLTGQPNFDNNAPLRVGYSPGESDGDLGSININLAELKIWKYALPEATIKQYSCDPSMDSSHPYYDYLVGYWPLNEGSGATMKDIAGPYSANFTLQGTYAWESFSDLLCSPSITALGTLVPKNSDIPAQILSWFNIARQDAWALDGKVWISN
ncbi:DUF4983 domain-containing protein [Pedobacter sp. PWIIR3]